ncbi:patatin-like phospholipase family protein [Salinispira pacifica]
MRRISRTIATLLLLFLLPAALLVGQESGAPERPKVALVLSGGGARGFAHIGVLKVIREIGIPIDLVVGTSMGSIIGGLYAAGYTPGDLADLAAEIDWGRLFADGIPRSGYSPAQQSEEGTLFGTVAFKRSGVVLPRGLVSGRAILSLLSCLTLPVDRVHNFLNLPIPFCAVAADLGNGEEVHLVSGNLSRALRASMSAPGVFAPVEVRGRLLVDGGILNNLPVDVAKKLGADIVIAVDITSPLEKIDNINDTVSVLRQMLKVEMVQSTRLHRKEATILITPDLGKSGFADFSSYAAIIKDGEKAAEAVRPQLLALAERLHAGAPTPSASAAAVPMLVHYDRISVAGADRGDGRLIREKLEGRGRAGVAPLELFHLSRRMEDTGRYQSVTYSLVAGEPGQAELHIRFLPTVPDIALLGAGLRFRYRSGDELRTGLAAHVGAVLNNLVTPQSSWLTDLYFGEVTGAEMIYHQTLVSSLYAAPELHAGESVHGIWSNGAPVGRERLTQAGGELALGIRPGAVFDLSAGYGLEWRSLAPFIGGSYTGAVSGGRDAYGFARIVIDTRDLLPLPSHGLFLRARYRYVDPLLGGTRGYQLFDGQASAAVSFLGIHTLAVGIHGGSSLGTLLPEDLRFGFGGSELFPGYYQDEVRTDNYLSAYLTYRIRIAGLPSQFPSDLPFGIYLFVRGDVGTVWETTFDPIGTPLFGGGLGIVAVTPFGEAGVDFWSSDRHPFLVSVSVGTAMLPRTRHSPFRQ